MRHFKISEQDVPILSTSSKGDQTKWNLDGIWVKQDARGYEGAAEVLASRVLDCSTLPKDAYVVYEPCTITLISGEEVTGCYSSDFRGTLQEVTLERLFEANFMATDDILNDKTLSTKEKFNLVFDLVERWTELDVKQEVSRLLAFDALILNEDRHTNNIVFLFDPVHERWRLAPIFDNGLSLLSDLKDYPARKPLTILKRQVKAKPFNTNFSKQLALYEGTSFLNKQKIQRMIESDAAYYGRAAEVLISQIKASEFQHLFIGGVPND